MKLFKVFVPIAFVGVVMCVLVARNLSHEGDASWKSPSFSVKISNKSVIIAGKSYVIKSLSREPDFAFNEVVTCYLRRSGSYFEANPSGAGLIIKSTQRDCLQLMLSRAIAIRLSSVSLRRANDLDLIHELENSIYDSMLSNPPLIEMNSL